MDRMDSRTVGEVKCYADDNVCVSTKEWKYFLWTLSFAWINKICMMAMSSGKRNVYLPCAAHLSYSH
jgi:hypothetical protein